MLNDIRKQTKYETDLCVYIYRCCLNNSKWSREDFKRMYSKLQTFLKRTAQDETSLLQSGFILLRNSGKFNQSIIEDLDLARNSIYSIMTNYLNNESEISIAVVIAMISVIVKYVATDEKLDYSKIESEEN